jgi:hypothetical protein
VPVFGEPKTVRTPLWTVVESMVEARAGTYKPGTTPVRLAVGRGGGGVGARRDSGGRGEKSPTTIEGRNVAV